MLDTKLNHMVVVKCEKNKYQKIDYKILTKQNLCTYVHSTKRLLNFFLIFNILLVACHLPLLFCLFRY